MAKLAGKSVNDVIVEYYGPILGRNYNTSGSAAPAAPSITVEVRGTGSIQLQQTQTYVIKGNAGMNNFTNDRVADPTTWADLGAPISAATGRVTVTPTVDNIFSSIRAIVVIAGTGKVVIQSDWN